VFVVLISCAAARAAVVLGLFVAAAVISATVFDDEAAAFAANLYHAECGGSQTNNHYSDNGHDKHKPFVVTVQMPQHPFKIVHACSSLHDFIWCVNA